MVNRFLGFRALFRRTFYLNLNFRMSNSSQEQRNGALNAEVGSKRVCIGRSGRCNGFRGRGNAALQPFREIQHQFCLVYGQALPPVGFVNFCTRHSSDCRALGGTKFQLEMNPERWELLNQVNSFVNANIKPETDDQIYRQAEFWEYPQKAGDCEDYVLLKKRYLEGLGFPAESLLITVVLDEGGDGHAVLMVKTDRGDLVLDNRRDNILLWNDTRYDFLKRQSQDDPQIWVSLTSKNRRGEMTIAGGN